jgi:hypothetical protein
MTKKLIDGDTTEFAYNDLLCFIPYCYYLLVNFSTVLSEGLNMPHLRIETNVKSADIKVIFIFINSSFFCVFQSVMISLSDTFE